MEITWLRDEGKLFFNDHNVDCVCHVRTELNGERLLSSQPVCTENEDGTPGVPYMPRPFPLGKWKVLAVIPETNPYLAPEFISTDAHQLVDEWMTRIGRDGNVMYNQKSGVLVDDFGYGLHNSTSQTTLGCGRIASSLDRSALTLAIKKALAAGEAVTLEVS